MTSEWRLIYQGLHLLTDNSKNCIGSMEWITIYVHVKQDFAINHPCSYFNGGLAEYTHQWAHTSHTNHGPVARYAKLGVAQAAGMPETFSPPLRVSDPDKHHGTCVTHVPWCISGSLTSGFLWNRWRGKCSRHSRRMDNPQFFLSGKRPMDVVRYPFNIFSYSLSVKEAPGFNKFALYSYCNHRYLYH